MDSPSKTPKKYQKARNPESKKKIEIQIIQSTYKKNYSLRLPKDSKTKVLFR